MEMHRARGMPARVPTIVRSPIVIPRPLPFTAVVCSPLIPDHCAFLPFPPTFPPTTLPESPRAATTASMSL